jgi:hypothetical protein
VSENQIEKHVCRELGVAYADLLSLDIVRARVTFARFEPRRLATSIPQRLSFENRVMRASDTLPPGDN